MLAADPAARLCFQVLLQRGEMKVFLPISDEILERMDGSDAPVPYQPGMVLWTSVQVIRENGTTEIPLKDSVSIRRQPQRRAPLPDPH